MAKDTTANWQDIDVASLPGPAQQAYEQYKVAQRAAAALREAFEASVRAVAPAPTGMRMVFGYRFGKLSAAIVEDEGRPVKARPKATLADFLAAQAASGLRA